MTQYSSFYLILREYTLLASQAIKYIELKIMHAEYEDRLFILKTLRFVDSVIDSVVQNF